MKFLDQAKVFIRSGNGGAGEREQPDGHDDERDQELDDCGSIAGRGWCGPAGRADGTGHLHAP